MEETSSAPSYEKKKAIRRDNIGLGVSLEILGIVIGVFYLATIIGPIVGLILFGFGYSIVRQRRYVCMNCGNELQSESRLCPICRATYDG